MSKHTPGPWGIESDKFSLIWIGPMRPDGIKVADIVVRLDHGSDYRPEYNARQEANAKLIAAAPELLQLAKDLLEQVEDEWPGCALVERANQLLSRFE
jgi:hypothetical protein